jgi:fructokinase
LRNPDFGQHAEMDHAASQPRLTLVGLGEALFDVFPDAQILGGAPLNFAVHAHQLVSVLGGCAYPVSRVGEDPLGRRVCAELERLGVSPRYIQTDAKLPTGQVLVTLDAQHQPQYEISEGVAWDALEFTDALAALAASCHGVLFGSLAQRHPLSHAAIRRFVQSAPQAIRLFDVNLRQHFYSVELIRESLALASAFKLNSEEMRRMAELFHLPGANPEQQARGLFEMFPLRHVILTRDIRGTLIFTREGEVFEGQPVQYPRSPQADNVGAGDACAAGGLVGLLLGWPLDRVVNLANHAGAYVASQPGATPQLPEAVLRLLF